MSFLGVKYAYYSLGMTAVGAFVVASVLHPMYHVRKYWFLIILDYLSRICSTIPALCFRNFACASVHIQLYNLQIDYLKWLLQIFFFNIFEHLSIIL
jgi:hypothetical protein